MKNKTIEERFWSKVDKRGPEECWPWTASRLPTGYGRLGIAGKMIYAHRVSFELSSGCLLPDQVVMHTCDNPSCVNPVHLRAGTQKENMQDCASKGRTVRGERAFGAKLTSHQAMAVREAHGTIDAIAAEFGVSRSTVSAIKCRVNWAYMD